MRFYLLYILRRKLKGYPYDIPPSRQNRVVFPLQYNKNLYFGARMDDSYFDETKVSRAVLQSLFIELYVYIDNFMLLWMHVFSMVAPALFSLKLMKYLMEISEAWMWIFYIPLWLVCMELIFSLLVDHGMKATREKIEKFFELKRNLLESLHINFTMPNKHCLWLVLLMNDDGTSTKDSEERGKLVFEDDEKDEKLESDEPDMKIDL